MNIGSGTGQIESGVPQLGIVNAPIDANRPPRIETGQPIIEVHCTVCGELTSRTYPTEINGEAVPTAPNEKYPCSCPSP